MEDKQEDKKLEDFIQDWQINIKDKSATHNTGLKMRYLMDNEDGTLRIELDKLVTWEREQLKNDSNGTAIVKLRDSLVGEFARIYKEKMAAPKKPLPDQINQPVGR
jgi:hypothetical protein